MDGSGKRLAQLAVQQHLRAVYGIKLKNRTGKRKASRSTAAVGGKVFGIPLHELSQVVCEYGNLPCFLVEACQYLEEHIQIEGLFRKSGSVVRLKTLKNKLDKGEKCLSSALPCDVAGLLKQFFRELPEPILPYKLQEALIKAQKLDSEERNSATLLISCLVNEEIIGTLRYFFQFLKKVSLRSAENKMDSCNLAVIFAPNLLQLSEIEKISVHTEKKLRLQAGVLQTLIDHAADIGQIPKFILEKIPSMLGIDESASTPVLPNGQESEIETPSEHLSKRRQSIGDIVSGALNKLKSNRTPSTTPQRDQCVFSSMTPVMVTPNFKRKYPADSCHRLSSKKRRSIGHSIGPEMLPNSLFNINLTPGSDSPFVSLDTSQTSLSTSATCEKSLSTIRSRRSKRIANKVQRVESGKTGCFSPKISRKEVVRRSLRLKFILGRSNRQNATMEHEDNHRAENIGHRLAGHQDNEIGVGTMKTAALLSPCVALLQRVAELEKVNVEFLRTKQNLEQEFNQKRAKFKELYLAKEEDLKKQNAELQAAHDDLEKLQKQLMEAQAEMENIKAIATVSENTKQEAIDDIKKQWQEDVASLQAIMKETVREYEGQFHHRLEQERSQWSQYRENVEREIAELRRRLSEGQEEENLENEMKKAQEDAEKLRSVVMPMEKEIATLKDKLTEAEERIKELEASKVKELNHYLEAEKSCRTDLEMYVAVLNTQKSVLQEDAEKLRKELHEVCHLLEQERQQHNQLKHTWQKANDQFLESQRLLMRDMQWMEMVLTSEQLRQVEELKKKDQEDEVQRRLHKRKEEKEKGTDDESNVVCSTVHEEALPPFPGEEVHLNSTHGSAHSLDTDALLSSGESLKSDNDMFKEGLRRAQSTDSLGTSGSLQAKSLGYNNKAKSAGNLDESDFGPLVGADSISENFDTASLGSLQMPGGFMLTKDQEKAITAMTPEQEETASLLSSITQSVENAYVSPSGYRLVSETEWNLLQKEVQNAGNKLGRRCDMCSNYEKQLQGIQIQEAETRDQVKKLQMILRQANDQLEKTLREKQELEEFMKQSSEDSVNQISSLTARAQESDALLNELQQAFSQAKRNVQDQMAVLMQSRELVSEELVRLQKDNESLQGKHCLHVSLQQAEDFILPETGEGLRELVLKYREDIISVRTAADHLEEKLKAEILFLKEQIQAEQCLKENIEETLQLEIENCKEEIAAASSLKTELEQIRVNKDQLESNLKEKIQQLENFEERENDLEEQLKKEVATKANLEHMMFEEKNKAQRLQTELDVSEQVQRDFVKLSQTLQVQLERIRQADSLERIRAILNDTKLTDINQLPET